MFVQISTLYSLYNFKTNVLTALVFLICLSFFELHDREAIFSFANTGDLLGLTLIIAIYVNFIKSKQ